VASEKEFGFPRSAIGWWLRPPVWHKGCSTKAARALLAYGFDTVGLIEIFSHT